MIISVGCFVNNESDLNKVKRIADKGVNCHLAFFHYEDFLNLRGYIPENFRYKDKKILKTPLHILKTCGRITLDTSHLDAEWLKSEILLKYLLMNADILHLSQRENNSSLS